jgi:hypothetical protein
VADDRKPIEAERAHDLHLIECHHALRVAAVVVAIGRLAAAAAVPIRPCGRGSSRRQS